MVSLDESEKLQFVSWIITRQSSRFVAVAGRFANVAASCALIERRITKEGRKGGSGGNDAPRGLVDVRLTL